MRKKLNNISDNPRLCPFFQENCKKDECMLFHAQFGKCNVEIVGYNLFKVSKAMEDLQDELKKQ